MRSNHNDQILNYFNSILEIDGRTFGQKGRGYHGLSDNAKGVQWNIAISNKNKKTRLGVNLEGITYQNWPIAKFIENEQKEMKLCNFNNLPQANKIIVGFYRDAWQCGSRPNIDEYHIQEIPLLQLNKNTYSSALNEAYNCLDASKNHRGRAGQLVTKKNKEVKMMEVSPHLNIHMYLSSYNSSKAEMEEVFAMLKPVYDLVMEQSK